MKSMKIRIKDNRSKLFLEEKIFQTKHFENILLILIKQDQIQNEGKNFNLLLDYEVMRAIITNTEGTKKKSEKINYMKDFYKNNKTMDDLIAVGQELKIHNLTEQIKDIKKNYKAYFTKLKNGDKTARQPKPKKLKKCSHITLCTDGNKSHSFSKKDKIGINVNRKMKYIYVKHEPILKVVGTFDNVRNINLNYSNGFVYLLINYKAESKSLENKNTKSAGLDIGINNLVSLYIDDNESDSLIIDGSKYKSYNSNFNRFISKINNEIDFWNNYLNDESKKELNVGLYVLNDIKYLCKFRSFIYEKRSNFFFSEFHKISKRVCEFLYLNNVSTLVLSTNLAKLKNNGNCNLSKESKQNFIQIPFMMLIKNLKEKAPKYGIKVMDVNESYTSKTSSLSADINLVKQKSLNNEEITIDDFKGSRVERGLFKDIILNKLINADLNGAKNIVNIGKKNIFKKEIKYKKLCNPLKFKNENKLSMYIKYV